MILCIYKLIFAFRKIKALREREKSERIRNNNNNIIYSNNVCYNDLNNYEYYNNNIKFIPNYENNYSHNISSNLLF